MAKRKGSETLNAESSLPAGAAVGSPDGSVDNGQPDHAAEELGGLAGEVQSFLSRRVELARKLAQEIEATEKKLAELKRTAALLFPAGGNGQSEKERQDASPRRRLLAEPSRRSAKSPATTSICAS